MIDAVVLLYSVATILLPTATEPAASPQPLSPALVRALASRPADAPDVEVWLHDDDYRRGDVARVEFRARDDAYVTVIRVDTDGRLRVLYPTSPHHDAWVRGGHAVRVPGRNGGTFTVNDDRGLGYVFAIASYDRFDFRRYADGDHWDERALGSRVSGDPFVAMHRVAERLLWDDRSPYSTAYDEYYVEGRHEYPRYVCYDCHSGSRRPRHWDPYDHHCSQFRVVIWSDPYYYPYRYYPGTRVVYARRPRYEFKEASPRDPITRTTSIERRRRDEGLDFRRPGSPTSDPNLPGGPRRNPGDDAGPSTGGGGTSPGEDVPTSGSKPGRRRGHEADGPGNSNNAPGHTGTRPPRRDDETPGSGGSGNGNGNGNGQGNGGGNGNGNPDRPRAPRGEGNGGGDGDTGSGNGGNGNGGGNGGNGSGQGGTGNGSDRRNGPPRRDGGSSSTTPDERGTDDRDARSRDDGWTSERRGGEPRDGASRSEPRDDRRSEPRATPRNESAREPRGSDESSRASSSGSSRRSESGASSGGGSSRDGGSSKASSSRGNSSKGSSSKGGSSSGGSATRRRSP